VADVEASLLTATATTSVEINSLLQRFRLIKAFYVIFSTAVIKYIN